MNFKHKYIKKILIAILVLFILIIGFLFFWDKSVENRVTKLSPINITENIYGFKWFNNENVNFLYPEDSVIETNNLNKFHSYSKSSKTAIDFSIITTDSYLKEKMEANNYLNFLSVIGKKPNNGDQFLLSDTIYSFINDSNEVIVDYEISKSFGKPVQFTLSYMFYIDEETCGKFQVTSDNKYTLAVFLRSITF